MTRRVLATAAAFAVSLTAAAQATVQSTPGGYPQYPSLTPDGAFAIFSWAGDLWSVPTTGGPATRLTSHPADELASAVSPNGRLLAFESDREGAKNIYVADLSVAGGTLVAGPPRRVTVSDTGQNLTGFTPDSAGVIFSSYMERDIYREEHMYRAPLDGGPVRRLTDAFGEHPSMTADGASLVFARGSNNGVRPIYRGPATGEIWKLDFATGGFEQLTNDRFDDIQPSVTPDGSVVFVSSRDGQYNLCRLHPGSPQVEQLTTFEPSDADYTIAHGVRDLAVSNDGSKAVFAVWDTLYTLDLDRKNAAPQAITLSISGDTDTLAMRRIDLDREATETALSPDGGTIAIVARGEIFVRSTKEDHPTRRVTESEAREQHIAWSPDGTKLYFVSDREGAPSIYAATVSLSRQDIEPKKAEEDADKAKDEDNAETGADTEPAEADESKGNDEAADKADKKEEKDKGPTPGDRWAQALQFTIEPVLVSDHTDTHPTPSPDGEEMLFVRDRGDLMLYDLEDHSLLTLQEGWDEPEAIWASDSEHIVFARLDLQFNSDLFLMNVDAFEDDPESDAAKPINITMHPDTDFAPRLSHDGKVLYFLSDRDNQNEEFDVYRVFLDAALEDLADYELAEYFDDAKKAAGELKPIEVAEPEEADEDADDHEDADDAENGDEEDADDDETTLEFDTADAFLRIRRITSFPSSENNLAITPAGDRILFTTSIDDDRALYSVDYKGKERKTVAGGGVSGVATSLTGDKAVFIKGGQANTAPPAGGEVTTLDISAPVTINTAAERLQKFDEAARTFGMTFYHPTLHGVDWDRATDRYRQLALNTRTSQAFTRVLATMFGEVNGSHTGSWGGDAYSAPSPAVGLLAIDATPVSNPDAAGYEVLRVLRDGPADNGDEGLLRGDIITEINGAPLADPATGIRDLQAAMIGTAGKETLFTVHRPGNDGPATMQLLLIPHSQGAETNMRYRDEVERREARVHELSNGRIGYLHIRGMSEPQVRDYERDLFAAAHGREGLIIDVRDNGGGWTTDILLASLTAPAHAYTIPRGANPDDVEFDSYPRDRRLIHAFQRPLDVLMNEHSYSNAEIFSHAIKTIGRGRLVGTETHGAVISTGAHALIDGTIIRIPFRGWYLPDGTDMELHGAKPDVDVAQLPGDEAAGRDLQLQAAVEDLLKQLDKAKP
ncbi:MAG: PD40 domain-containing protein [Phycisphaeraceae bacterium]|nr:MAG: PD40 domain-containing protein [Phycisphaeraceae bacterium]